jgi:hypothetical protein
MKYVLYHLDYKARSSEATKLVTNLVASLKRALKFKWQPHRYHSGISAK